VNGLEPRKGVMNVDVALVTYRRSPIERVFLSQGAVGHS
jgi:hypothetical protein